MNEELIFKYFPDLDSVRKEKIEELYRLYSSWNAKINVVSRKDIEQLYLHHVLHSLAIVKFMEEKKIRAERIIDVGTGGGFPGIPMAILMPEVSFTLCDSIAKKIKVVTEIAGSLGLDNVIPVRSRSEDLKGNYDFVVSRGVSELREFVPLVKNLYGKGIIYLKGGDVEREVEECVRGERIDKKLFSIVNISTWFEEEFFSEKKIILINR